MFKKAMTCQEILSNVLVHSDLFCAFNGFILHCLTCKERNISLCRLNF